MESEQSIDRLREIVEADGEPDDASVAQITEHLTADEVASALGALVPGARARHSRIGLSREMSDETLADIERKHRLYGADTVAAWLIGILRGDVVQVGRLQVERRAGDRGHALHIPETGSLAADAVSDALDRARTFTGSRRFSCTSWLLDRELGAALPESNIASFARRFDIVADEGDEGDGGDGDEEVAKFVFRQKPTAVVSGSITPRTRLERLVMERLRSGPRWTQPIGVLRD